MRIGPRRLAWLVGLVVLLGGGTGRSAQEEVATCPVDGKVSPAAAAVRVIGAGEERLRLCSDRCLQAFAAAPEPFLAGTLPCPVLLGRKSKPDRQMRRVVNNDLYYLCCLPCIFDFDRDPAPYVKTTRDPVSGVAFAPKPNGPSVHVGEQVYLFASDETRQAFEKDPGRFVVRYR